MAWYDTGTIAVTNGSTAVVGTGTQWVTGAQVGEAMLIDNVLYEIQSIVSATSLTLADNYLAATQSGLTYKIVPTQSLVADLASDVTNLISDYATIANNAGAGKFNDGTVTSPGIQFLQDSDNGLYRIGSNNWGMVAGGAKIVDVSTTGIDVTGTATMDGLVVDNLSLDQNEINSNVSTGDIFLGYSKTDNVYIYSGGTTGAGTKRIKVDNSGDISFYEDTGTTAKFFWDASAEKLNLSGTGGLDVTGTATMDGLISQDTSKAVKFTGFKSNGTGLAGSVTHGEIVLGDTPAYQGIITYNGTEGDMYIENTWVDASALTHITFDDKKVLTAQGNGDISFYEATGTTAKFFWDASAESLGIGTSSPADNLDINHNNNNGGEVGLQIHNTNAGTVANFAGLITTAVNGTVGMRVQAASIAGLSAATFGSTTSHPARFVTADVERMRIDSSGNLGIGTSSPSTYTGAKLSVIGSGIYTNTGYALTADCTYFTPSGLNAIPNYGLGEPVLSQVSLSGFSGIPFYTNQTEKMRIDSSGNVLVGKTAPALSTAGIELRADNTAYFTKDSDTPVLVNRITDDGDLIQFRKDNTTVGSIGSRSGVVSTIVLNPASGNGAGLSGGTKTIVPADEAGIIDNDISLGISSHRFKDLYLSSGVYLGGTGAANKLDDYEEGTWTATANFVTGSAATASSLVCKYIKIGKQVSIIGRGAFVKSTDTGVFTIGGLPFTSNSTTNFQASVCFAPNQLGKSGNTLQGYVDSASTSIALQFKPQSSSAQVAVVASDMGTNETLRFTVIYETD